MLWLALLLLSDPAGRELYSRLQHTDRYGEGGCRLDVDGDGRLDIVLQEGQPLGKLVWLRAPEWRASLIDTGVEMHDCLPATLFGRKGFLMIQRFQQVRFYQPPEAGSGQWQEREIYSIYTASRQTGLVLADVDGDGRPDILCGNYWIRSPESFELPWRLFAINVLHREPWSAAFRLALLEPGDLLAAIQAHLPETGLRLFRKADDPKREWLESEPAPGLLLHFPHALASGDLNGDGLKDLAVGENAGPGSRLFVLWNGGNGRLRPQLIAHGSGFTEAAIGSGRLETAGAGGIRSWNPGGGGKRPLRAASPPGPAKTDRAPGSAPGLPPGAESLPGSASPVRR